ncbi:MAG: phosphoribosylformylglycinamidine synthase subunit PurL [Opitutaceae bacterium]
MHAALLPPNPDPSLNERITPEIVAKHGLLPEEYEIIKRALHRLPTLTELGVFGGMWSERCSYKNTRALLKQLPAVREGDASAYGKVLVKAGEENAGIVDIGDGWALAFKIESHNHPTALKPFEGASTGVGGIIRDISAVGARPVLLANSLRVGALAAASGRRVFRDAVAGIAHYGNSVGIPDVGGDAYFDKCYEGNPLVNVLCLGVLRHDRIRHGRASGIGNPIYYVGASTGRDGLRDASFASKAIRKDVGEDLPSAAKGDPSFGKLLIEACLEMGEAPGLIVGMQDFGAAGLASAVCETASRGGSGIEIELDKVPLREAGMNSYEILLSESQERMLVIVQRGREGEIDAICLKRGLNASRIGVVTDTGRMVAGYRGVTVADIPVNALTDKAPIYFRNAIVPMYFVNTSVWTPESAGLPDLDQKGVCDTLPRLLAHPTIASKRWIHSQFKQDGQPGTLVVSGSDAAVVRLRLGDKDRFIAIGNDGNGRYCYLNPRRGALIAMAECLRNLACAGAVPLAMTDCLNFGNPYRPESFYQLKEAVRGLAEACRFFDIPVLGGNVSLYNESPARSIDPSPIVSIVGLIEDEKHITTQWVHEAGENIVLLGGIPHELGGSQYLNVVHDLKTGDAPTIDLGSEERLVHTVRTLIRSGLVSGAHDLSEGGLLVAISEMLFAQGKTFGARLDLTNISGGRNDALLFGESQGCILLAVRNAVIGRVISESHMQGVCAVVIGEVSAEGVLAIKTRSIAATWNVADLRHAWETSIEETMKLPEA